MSDSHLIVFYNGCFCLYCYFLLNYFSSFFYNGSIKDDNSSNNDSNNSSRNPSGDNQQSKNKVEKESSELEDGECSDSNEENDIVTVEKNVYKREDRNKKFNKKNINSSGKRDSKEILISKEE